MASESTQLQLAAILGPDPSPFESLIALLMSPSNELRSHAESIFNFVKQNDPNSLALKLVNHISSTQTVESRGMSAVLLRKCLTQGDSFMWPQLHQSSQSMIKGMILTCIQLEESRSIVKTLCDTVSELASSILLVNGWPELLPFLFKCVISDSVKLQELAFWIFSQLAEYVGKLIRFVNALHSVFLKTLNNSPNLNVKIAALGSVVNVVGCLSSPSDREKFQELLPLMMKTLTEALNNGREAAAQEALEMLIQLAETNPSFFRKQIEVVVGSMLQITEADSLEEGTRHLAIEFVITLADARERAPGMIRKLPQFISRLFGILLKMLLDIDDELAWHSAKIEHEAAGETSNYSIGRECLDKLSIALGGNTIVPVAFEQLSAYLAAPEWKKQHDALIAVGLIAEACSKIQMSQ